MERRQFLAGWLSDCGGLNVNVTRRASEKRRKCAEQSELIWVYVWLQTEGPPVNVSLPVCLF